MRRALITGGAGFIGSHLADHLIASGFEVSVLDDFSTGSRANLTEAGETSRLKIVEGTVLSGGDIDRAMSGCDIVFHLAVRSVRHSLGDPIDNHHVNATGTLNALEAARRAGIRRFVYCSSSEVYGNAPDAVMTEDVTVCRPVTVYGGSKLAGEYYTTAYRETYGLPTVVVRPFNAYGPRAHVHGQSGEVIPRFVARILNGQRPVIFGNGANTRDFTFVTEIARGIARASEVDDAVGQVVNIAYGRAVSILDLSTLIAAACEREDITPELRAARPGDVLALHADVSRCRRVLGFKPEIELKDGLQRYLTWIRRAVNDVSSLLDDEQINWRKPL